MKYGLVVARQGTNTFLLLSWGEMKIKHALLLPLLGALLMGVCCPPTFAASKAAMPAAVRATMPRGAKSFLMQRLPLGYKGTPRLVHIWAVTRPRTPESNQYSSYTDSPFCVDIFEPRLDSKKRWGWHFLTSASYIDQDEPVAIVTHWLRPATKQGPVLEIISGNGAPGVSIVHRVLAWENGFGGGYSPPTPQTFESGGSGGGLIEQSFDGVDERGYMTITSRNSFGGKTISTTVSRWNGEQFVASITKQ